MHLPEHVRGRFDRSLEPVLELDKERVYEPLLLQVAAHGPEVDPANSAKVSFVTG
jgi:hypothetical protein